MNKRDKFLGLGNKITRRDFMQGVAGFSASLAVSKAFGERKALGLLMKRITKFILQD